MKEISREFHSIGGWLHNLPLFEGGEEVDHSSLLEDFQNKVEKIQCDQEGMWVSTRSMSTQ